MTQTLRLSLQADLSLPLSCLILFKEGGEPEGSPRILCTSQRPSDMGVSALGATAPSALVIMLGGVVPGSSAGAPKGATSSPALHTAPVTEALECICRQHCRPGASAQNCPVRPAQTHPLSWKRTGSPCSAEPPHWQRKGQRSFTGCLLGAPPGLTRLWGNEESAMHLGF